jgi:3',5'-cyclic AMP phosphodiesterase CpdA
MRIAHLSDLHLSSSGSLLVQGPFRSGSSAGAGQLAASFPDLPMALRLLQADPANPNLRFCAVAHQLLRDSPDHIVITGDLTDGGQGYELILKALGSFVERGALSCVPGNHDLYPLYSPASRFSVRLREAWQCFDEQLGHSGPLHRVRDDILLVCLDSCVAPRVLPTASGMVPQEAMDQVGTEITDFGGLKIAALHHHVVNPPRRIVGFAPPQAGMRLRNKRTVLQWMIKSGFSLVLNGHRHLGYRYHPPQAPMFVSAPSTTMGCKSGSRPFYWIVEVSDHCRFTVDEVPIPALKNLGSIRH